jgi:hypothetical protein
MTPIFLPEILTPVRDLRRRRTLTESTTTTADIREKSSSSSGAACQLMHTAKPNMAVESVAGDESDDKVAESFEWTVENEVHLFNALKNRRPVGLNRNFQMMFISETFNSLVNRDVPSSVLWDHLSEMYDMDTLNENDSPASSIVDEKDFALSSDFDELIEKKISSQTESAPASSSTKATSLLKPAGNSTPKQSKSKSEGSARKEVRSGKVEKEEDSKSDDGLKSAKKKNRPSESSSKSATPASAKKRRN